MPVALVGQESLELDALFLGLWPSDNSCMRGHVIIWLPLNRQTVCSDLPGSQFHPVTIRTEDKRLFEFRGRRHNTDRSSSAISAWLKNAAVGLRSARQLGQVIFLTPSEDHRIVADWIARRARRH